MSLSKLPVAATVLLALGVLVCPGRAAGQAPPAQDPADGPARFTFIEKQDGKPPVRTFHVGLVLRNRRDEPVWFVLPYYGDEPLPADGKFKNTGGFERPLEADDYDGDRFGGQGKAVRVRFLGDGFYAFRLPAAGSLAIADYPIHCWSDIRRVEVWEVADLRVNGRTPLEDWLPFKTLGTSHTLIPFWTKANGLDWDPARSQPRTDYPKERVDFVTARVLKKWEVPLREPDAADLAKVRAVRTDLRDLQGVWKVVAHERNGEKVPPEELAREYVRIAGTRIQLAGADHRFRIDPTADPKGITVEVAGAMKQGAAQEGIYQVGRDRLKICLSLSLEEGTRPKEFAGKRGIENLLLEPSPP
jgi:uncharacterized protein (TIGR03067 family)